MTQRGVPHTPNPTLCSKWPRPSFSFSETPSPTPLPLTCFCTQRCAAVGRRVAAGSSSLDKSMLAALGLTAAASGSVSSMSARPTMSSTRLNPRPAMISRTSSAIMKK